MSTKEYTAFMKKGTFNMKYAIVYSSKTGNTKLLATTIQECLPQEDCIYFGEPSEEALKADYIFVGFWTDKGSCDGEAKKFLKKLDEKKVVFQSTFSNREVVFPVGSDIDEVDVRTLAKFFISLFTIIDVSRHQTFVL